MQFIFKKSIIAAAFVFGAVSISFGQVKVGNNPTLIDGNSNLEVEATSNQKVIVHKDNGTVVIENTPAGATTDKYLTVDGTGNVRSITPVANGGFANIYRGGNATAVNIGSCPSATLVASGYFTTCTCTNANSSGVGKTILTFTFQALELPIMTFLVLTI